MTSDQRTRPARSGEAAAPRATLWRCGAGEKLRAGAVPVTVQAVPETGGAALVHEQCFPPLSMVAAHTHREIGQYSRVLSGELCFLAGSEVWTLREGDAIYRPAGICHAVWNPSGSTQARQVEVSVPGRGMYRFFRDCEELAAGGQLTPQALAAAARRCGTRFDLELTREIELLYHVSAQGGGPQWA